MFNLIRLIKILFFLLPRIVFAEPYTTTAKQAILVDGNTGQILYQYNANQPMHPSSMTKIMTTYLAFDEIKSGRISLNDKFPTSEKAWKMAGSRMFLNYGDMPTIDDLLKGIIVQSGNDACVVMAEGLAGDENLFVDKMNNIAKKVGMINTNFTNASGWPDPNNLSTAQDLSKLAIALIKNFPDLYSYHQIKQFSYGNISQTNRNLLLGRIGVDGIKTGHTEAGGYGIVLSALQNDRRLIAVINGLITDKERAQEGERILNYGFKGFTRKILVGTSDILAKPQVIYGESPQVKLSIKNDMEILTKNSNEAISCTIFYTNQVLAPIAMGQKLGTITCKVDNIYDSEFRSDLVADSNVRRANFLQRLIQNIERLVL